MAKFTVVVLSGPIGVGKSTLATGLANKYSGRRVSTSELIKSVYPQVDGREDYQKKGDLLDERTDGRWVRNQLGEILGSVDNTGLVIVDSVRLSKQVSYLRESYGHAVVHVHLTAPPDELERRFRNRKGKVGFTEAKDYSSTKKNLTEKDIESLSPDADIVIHTDRTSELDVQTLVAAKLGLTRISPSSYVDVIVGGQYGSEGKGQIVGYLAREYDVLVRVGGPNAGHKVYHTPSDQFTFHHLPSGTTKNDSSCLILGPGTVINTDLLLKEIADRRVGVERLIIDPKAILINKADIHREAALAARIGSTKQGVGSATARKIMDRGSSKTRLANDDNRLQKYVHDTNEVLQVAFSQGKRILLEGTQGTGLSLHHGHYPHVTSRDTTISGCLAEAGIPPSIVRRTILVCRTYPIRVQSPEEGTSGHMESEITWAEVARRSGIPVNDLRKKEKTSTTNRKRRVAEFSWSQLLKSVSLNGPTDIALTFVDYLSIQNRMAARFEQLQSETIRFIEEVESISGVPISIIAKDFGPRAIIDRRSW